MKIVRKLNERVSPVDAEHDRLQAMLSDSLKNHRNATGSEKQKHSDAIYDLAHRIHEIQNGKDSA